MANTKKITKQLLKLDENELKEVLEFLMDDEDKEEEPQEQVEEKVETQVVEEQQEEEQKDEVKLTLDKVQEMINNALGGVVTKDIFEKTISEVSKKATPFGVKQSVPPKKEQTNTKSANDYLEKINQQFR